MKMELQLKRLNDAVVGESYVLDSVSYLVVDSAMLYQMVANEEDLTKVVTSNVTNMEGCLSNFTAFVYVSPSIKWKYFKIGMLVM